MQARGIRAQAADVLVTNGSQQVLDLVGKILLNPGDAVLTENPTYLAAIQAFHKRRVALAERLADFVKPPAAESS